jgi:hypothetical protein
MALLQQSDRKAVLGKAQGCRGTKQMGESQQPEDLITKSIQKPLDLMLDLSSQENDEEINPLSGKNGLVCRAFHHHFIIGRSMGATPLIINYSGVASHIPKNRTVTAVTDFRPTLKCSLWGSENLPSIRSDWKLIHPSASSSYLKA